MFAGGFGHLFHTFRTFFDILSSFSFSGLSNEFARCKSRLSEGPTEVQFFDMYVPGVAPRIALRGSFVGLAVGAAMQRVALR